MLEKHFPRDNGWIARNYGSKRGLIISLWYQCNYYIGRYRGYKNIDWTSVDRLVFVCKGNICRSAYAEAVARSLGVSAISCGLDTIEGAPANEAAIRVAERLGFDLKRHKTSPLDIVSFRPGDLLIAMEPGQAVSLQNNLKGKYQCSLLGLWTSPYLPHIYDPYGASSCYFENCFLNIQQSVDELAIKIKKK